MYQERLKIDWWTVAIWAVLTVFGVLNIYSATYSGDMSSLFSLSTYGGKQLLWLAIATVAAILILFTEPRFFSNGAYPIYAVVMLLLVATLFLAVTVNGRLNGFIWNNDREVMIDGEKVIASTLFN